MVEPHIDDVETKWWNRIYGFCCFRNKVFNLYGFYIICQICWDNDVDEQGGKREISCKLAGVENLLEKRWERGFIEEDGGIRKFTH